MRRVMWSVLLGTILLSVSFTLYTIHYLAFGDLDFILKGGFGSLAFVPIQGLVVTLIIAELLVVMGRRSRLEKMRMVIGIFFSEMGTGLLKIFCAADRQSGRIEAVISEVRNWPGVKVPALMARLPEDSCRTDMSRDQLDRLKAFLVKERGFLARLLENPNLLEDERFTQLLWAVFHLVEELDARVDIASVPDSDLEHLNGDVNRVYLLLFREWVYYMKHLNGSYPYLFSFAMRTSPLHPGSQAEVV